jgi:hypothetical protein
MHVLEAIQMTCEEGISESEFSPRLADETLEKLVVLTFAK